MQVVDNMEPEAATVPPTARELRSLVAGLAAASVDQNKHLKGVSTQWLTAWFELLSEQSEPGLDVMRFVAARQKHTDAARRAHRRQAASQILNDFPMVERKAVEVSPYGGPFPDRVAA